MNRWGLMGKKKMNNHRPIEKNRALGEFSEEEKTE